MTSTRSPTDQRRSALPGRRLTSFLGRDADLDRLTKSLHEHRLVTLLGSGGVGKTRLAEEVLHGIAATGDEVAWAELAPIDSPDQIGEVIARAVGLGQVPAGDVLDHVIARLADRRMVLVLDNAEHLIDATADVVVRLLEGCQNLTVLVTSREVLALAGEAIVRLPTLNSSDGAELFVQRQRLVASDPAGPDDPAVRRICARLDGIPLAIELAASRSRALTPSQIADALDDRFTILTGGPRTALPRQQTLEASVAWSVDLLDEEQKTLLAALSVFAGGFTIDAAVHVADGTLPVSAVRVGVLDLADRSLVHAADTQLDKPRFRLLETVRQYARQRLAENSRLADLVRERHIDWHLAQVREIHDLFDGPDWPECFLRLDEEVADLTAAIHHAEEADPRTAIQLVCLVCDYWVRRPQIGAMSERALALYEEVGASTPDLARAAVGVAELLGWHAHPRTLEIVEDAITQTTGVAGAEMCTLNFEGMRAWILGHGALEREADLMARVEQPENEPIASALWFCFGVCHWHGGSLDRAVELFERWVHTTERGQSTLKFSNGHPWAALIMAHAGLPDRADELLSRAWPSIVDADDAVMHSIALCVEGLINGLRGRVDEAADVRERALAQGTRLAGNARPRLRVLNFWGLIEPLLGHGYDDLLDWGTVDAGVAARYEPTVLIRSALRALSEGNAAAAVGPAEAAEVLTRSAAQAAANFASPAKTRSAALLTLAKAHRATGHPDASTSAHEALQRHVEREWVFWPDALDVVAAVDADACRHDRAARLLAASDRRRTEMGTVRWPTDQPWVDQLIAQVRRELGDDGYQAAYQAGLQLDQDAAMALARTGRDERPVAGWDSLTPAEQETAKLAAEGLSNPAIAEQLFISRNTVKTHLSAAYRKLAVANRTELATAIPR